MVCCCFFPSIYRVNRKRDIFTSVYPWFQSRHASVLSLTYTHTTCWGNRISPVTGGCGQSQGISSTYKIPRSEKHPKSLTHIDASSRIKYKGSWAQTYAPTGPSLPGAAHLLPGSDLDSPDGWTTGCGARRWASPGISQLFLLPASISDTSSRSKGSCPAFAPWRPAAP